MKDSNMTHKQSKSTDPNIYDCPLSLTLRSSEGFVLTGQEFLKLEKSMKPRLVKRSHWLVLVLGSQSILTVTSNSVGISMDFGDSPLSLTRKLKIRALTMKLSPGCACLLDLLLTQKRISPTSKQYNALMGGPIQSLKQGFCI